jgi:phage terminase small subunit
MAGKSRKTSARAGKPAKVKAGADKGSTAKSGLSIQQRLFVAEYLKDRNGTQAAIRAGYSARSAYSQAERLLRNAEIKAQIEAFVIKAEEKVGLTVERTLREVARLAFFDPRKLLNPDGSPKPINELDDDTAACLAGMEVLEQFEGSGSDRVFVGHVKKYKIADKNAALEKAMKHLGQYERDNAQVLNPLADLFKQVMGTPLKPAGD